MSDETVRRSGVSDRDDDELRLGRLEKRLEAVERAATGTDASVADLSSAAELDARLTAVEEQLSEFDDRLSELDAAVQALRGYVGGVRAVNRAVERRADAAIAAVESLERDRPNGDAVDEILEGVEGENESASSEPTDAPDCDADGAGDETETGGASGLAARLRETW
ncbi:hypothetical protein [Haloprofundus sp. MHR1]|uniref:DUF7310 family coiled-coil domain-containing protein n=1 Tax=Haloprofundus sp. MHR1 TaxID=2572921 RepID=UPI0010BF406C|nr:hypothetical protein [Haloprofundus sp. MHR1]QCJ47571.1 hypothetical protein FCF25_10780 [Haloprofundus sp. MHR1]